MLIWLKGLAERSVAAAKRREAYYRIETKYLTIEIPESALPYWYEVHGNGGVITKMD